MTNKHMDNEDGSAGGIFTLVSVFLLAVFLFLVNGYVIDQLTAIANSMFATIAATQMRYDVFNYLVMLFRFQPIIVLLGLGVNQLISANSREDRVVPLSTLGLAVVEMEFVTILVMALEMYGGYGLDAVVSTVTGMGLGASGTMGTPGYGLIMMIPNVFYGILLLVAIGATIMFILRCVQITEGSNSFLTG